MDPNNTTLKKELIKAASSSGKYNRYCTIKSCVEKKVNTSPIHKISGCKFEIGSSFTNRTSNKKSKEAGEKVKHKCKRKSFYGNITENGVIRYLLSNPDKLYFWVWKNLLKEYKSTYVNSEGIILDYEKEVKPYLKDHRVYLNRTGDVWVVRDYETGTELYKNKDVNKAKDWIAKSPYEEGSPQRVYHYENVFYIALNGKVYKSDDYDLYNDYLDDME